MVEFKKKIKDEFFNYVSDYDINNPKIRLKIDHTYRVADLCEKIASDVLNEEDDINLSYLLGILHDIGRFKQIKTYNTFNDSESVDHAEFGADVLFKDGMIKKFLTDDKDYDLIEKAIRCHNKYRIPDGLEKRTECMAKILRDADKIDILKVNSTVPLQDIYNVSSEEIYNSAITDEVLDNFLREDTVLRKFRKTPADGIVTDISLVFGLNYKKSVQIAKENGDIDKLINLKWTNNDTNQKLEKMIKIINSYMDKRLK